MSGPGAVEQPPGPREPARVTLHIGRLVLHGVDPRQADAVRAALTAELSRLLAAVPADGWRSSRRRRVVAPDVSTVAGDSGAVGGGIAGAVYRGVTSMPSQDGRS